MVFLYLILKAILKAGQLCLAAMAVCVFLSCSSTEVAEPSRPDDGGGADSTGHPRDSVPHERPDTLSGASERAGSLSANAISFPDVEFSLSYWQTFGKTDPVSVRKPGMDSEEWFGAEPYYTCQGSDLYRNSAVMFAVDITPSWSDDFEGEIRLVYLDADGEVIGQTCPVALSGNRERTVSFFDYIAFAPQRIRIMPVVRRLGTSEWICPVSSGYYNTWYMAVAEEHEIRDWPDADWGFTVRAEREGGRLLVRDLYNEGMTEGSYRSAMNNIKQKGQEFRILFVLANPSGKAMKGTLILRDDHGFRECYQTYRPCHRTRKSCDLELEEWSREIGRMELDIPAGVEGWRDTITASIGYSNYLSYASSCQHLYFQPEGEGEAYLLTKDWRHLLSSGEKGLSASWGANAAWIKVR